MNPISIFGRRNADIVGDRIKHVKYRRGWLHIVRKYPSDLTVSLFWTLRFDQTTGELLGAMNIEEAYDLFNDLKANFVWKQTRRMNQEVRDVQAKRLYDWEDKVIVPYQTEKTEDEMRTFLNMLATTYDVNLTKIVFRKAGRKSYAQGSTISLIPQHMNYAIACHEFAHLYVEKLRTHKVAFHGALFVATYISLVAKHIMGHPDPKAAEVLKASAKRSKLTVGELF